jgi:hypothetical protein
MFCRLCATWSVHPASCEAIALFQPGGTMSTSFIALQTQLISSVVDASSGRSFTPLWGGAGLVAAAACLGLRPSMLMRVAMRLARRRGTCAKRARPSALVALNRMARELDGTQPNQAAELRWLAAHGVATNGTNAGAVRAGE